jgi:hypothetical protein
MSRSKTAHHGLEPPRDRLVAAEDLLRHGQAVRVLLPDFVFFGWPHALAAVVPDVVEARRVRQVDDDNALERQRKWRVIHGNENAPIREKTARPALVSGPRPCVTPPQKKEMGAPVRGRGAQGMECARLG